MLLLLTGITCIAAAGATYAGDKPLTSFYEGDIHGGYLFDMGDSRYSQTLEVGDQYNVSYSIPVPADATNVHPGRLYVYWAWSKLDTKAIYPTFAVTDSRDPAKPLNLSARYVDSKGFVSNYDFYSGTDVYDMSPLSPGDNAITIRLRQDGAPNSTVVLFGDGLLTIYESPKEPRTLLWVKEGCDLLFASYGISPAMATNTMAFNGTLPGDKISHAEIFLVAPSGGYSRDRAADLNTLTVNRLEDDKTPPLIKTIFSLLFPNYKGKEWRDIYDYDNTTTIGFETKEIKPYLRTENNRIAVTDQGDYFQLSNAILSITMEGETA